MDDFSRWLTPGRRVSVGIAMADSAIAELRCEVISCQHDTVRLDIVLPELTPPPLPVYGCSASLSYVTLGKFNAFTGHCLSCSSTTLELKLSDRQDPRERRHEPRYSVDLCFAYRSLGHIDDDGLERSWKLECARTANNGLPQIIESNGSYNIFGWRNSTTIISLPVNISTGGMVFLSLDQLQPGSYIFAYLFLPFATQRHIPVIANVVRSMPVTLAPYMTNRYKEIVDYLGSRQANRNAVKFAKINHEDQEAILSYLTLADKKQRTGR